MTETTYREAAHISNDHGPFLQRWTAAARGSLFNSAQLINRSG